MAVKKVKKNIVTILAGVSLSTSLVAGNAIKENYPNCEELAKKGIKFLEVNGENKAVGAKAGYDKPGIISSNEYDKCLIENFERGAPGYTIRVIKIDPPIFWRNNLYYRQKRKADLILIYQRIL